MTRQNGNILKLYSDVFNSAIAQSIRHPKPVSMHQIHLTTIIFHPDIVARLLEVDVPILV